MLKSFDGNSYTNIQQLVEQSKYFELKSKQMSAKTIFYIVLISLLQFKAYSQNSYIKSRTNLKLGMSNYKELIKNVSRPNFRVEMNHGFNRFLEIGAYLGYSKFLAYQPRSGGESGYAPTLFYGLTANFHLLPLIVKQRDFRFDVYLTGKFGGNYYFTPAKDWIPARGHRTEYGSGLGLSFYVFKNLGLFSEYTIGRFSYFDNYSFSTTEYYAKGMQTNIRFGLTYKYRRFSPSKRE
jgi:hypothetical protein